MKFQILRLTPISEETKGLSGLIELLFDEALALDTLDFLSFSKLLESSLPTVDIFYRLCANLISQ